MKYKLKKDLPFAKAGAEIVHIEMSITQSRGYDLTSKGVRLWINKEQDLDDMMNEGWIERVKPREFWINEQALMNLHTPDYIEFQPTVPYIRVVEIL